MTNALAWTPPIGHADIAPSRFERIEGDGYLTLDAPWVVPALLRSVPIRGRVLEPAAGRGHISRELKRAGCAVESFDIRAYESPLVPDIGLGDIRKLESLAGFSWVVTNLPYGDLEELAEILVKLGTRDRCNVALLVRAEWPIAKARHNLIHRHPWFHGVVMLDLSAAVGSAGAGDSFASAQLRLGGVGRAAARRRPVAPLRRQAGAEADAARPV